MKNLFKLFAFTVLMFASAAGTFAQVNTASASATATILTPISITKNTDMNFGNLATNGLVGTVVLPPVGARGFTGGVTLMPAGTVAAAQFTVTGLTGTTYTVTLPASALITNGTDQMTVDNFTCSLAALNAGSLATGTEVFTVGATLQVAVGQPTGVYTSTSGAYAPFDVTVNYN